MVNQEKITKKIIEYCNILPDICAPFLLETGTEMANTTRLAYAKELNCFFDYLISYHPHFCELEKRKIERPDLRHITSQDVSRYITIYKDQGHAERTTARKRAALSSFFNYMVKNRQLEFNPVLAAAKVKIHQSDEVLYLNIDEQIDFLDAIETGNHLDEKKQVYHAKYKVRDVALITLLLDTGIRVSELHGINVEDIDFDQSSVLITRKGGNLQTIYFSDDTSGRLLEYLEERQIKEHESHISGPFFVTNQGNRLSVRAIEVLVKKYASASVPGKGAKLSPHKMRSSFAMEYYDSTKDILALQRKLGHKNLAATNIYAKATDRKMQETRSVLAQKRAKKGCEKNT